MNRRFTFYLFLFAFLLSSCANNTNVDNSLKKYFDENKVDGCFGMSDNLQNRFDIYNLPRYRDSAYLPASTYKVVNSLIALHTGKIFSDTVVIPWDGITRRIPDWNKDMNMQEAFQSKQCALLPGSGPPHWERYHAVLAGFATIRHSEN